MVVDVGGDRVSKFAGSSLEMLVEMLGLRMADIGSGRNLAV